MVPKTAIEDTTMIQQRIAIVILAVLPSSGFAQLACDSPLDIRFGSTDVQTLKSSQPLMVSAPCAGDQAIEHAGFYRFTAPSTGWYAIHLVPTDPLPWRPRLAVIPSCTEPAAIMFGWPHYGRPLCEEDNFEPRTSASVTVHVEAGQTRLIVIGGDEPGDAGSAILKIAPLGSTLMDGARILAVGDNQFTAAALEPALPYTGACGVKTEDRMNNASRFAFTPQRSGQYTISFCNSSRYNVALSTSPDLAISTVVTTAFGCLSGGGITAELDAGTTYFVAAGDFDHYDACATLNALVESGDGCLGDLDDDGSVGGGDLALLLSTWGTAAHDLNGDGTTDGSELATVLGRWGACGS